MPFEKES